MVKEGGMWVRLRIPPATRGRIDAVRGAMAGIARQVKSAKKACEAAQERHGYGSPQHTRAYARQEESDRIMHGTYRMLEGRLKELENPREEGYGGTPGST